jgi:hypothetical protein
VENKCWSCISTCHNGGFKAGGGQNGGGEQDLRLGGGSRGGVQTRQHKQAQAQHNLKSNKLFRCDAAPESSVPILILSLQAANNLKWVL